MIYGSEMWTLILAVPSDVCELSLFPSERGAHLDWPRKAVRHSRLSRHRPLGARTPKDRPSIIGSQFLLRRPIGRDRPSNETDKPVRNQTSRDRHCCRLREPRSGPPTLVSRRLGAIPALPSITSLVGHVSEPYVGMICCHHPKYVTVRHWIVNILFNVLRAKV